MTTTPIDPGTHTHRPWRVHALARDFRLLDAWRIPIDADPSRGQGLRDFYRVFLENGVGATNAAPLASQILDYYFHRPQPLRTDAAAQPPVGEVLP